MNTTQTTPTRTSVRVAATALTLILALVALAPAASAGPKESGHDSFTIDDSITWLCGFPLDRHLDFSSNWVLKFNKDGSVRTWQGTLNVAASLTNPENGRTETMHTVGIDREVYLADGTLTVHSTGVTGWIQLPGEGPAHGVAGLLVLTIDQNGDVTSAEFNGVESGDGPEICDYFAGA